MGTNNPDCCVDRVCIPIQENKNGKCKIKPKFKAFTTARSKTVPFLTNSISNAATIVTGYFWDFGDSKNSTLANPTHTYANFGTYNVCLTVFGANGVISCSKTTCNNVTVSP